MRLYQLLGFALITTQMTSPGLLQTRSLSGKAYCTFFFIATNEKDIMQSSERVAAPCFLDLATQLMDYIQLTPFIPTGTMPYGASARLAEEVWIFSFNEKPLKFADVYGFNQAASMDMMVASFSEVCGSVWKCVEFGVMPR
ncbi:hypothetical protein EV360DRAFT_66339 [Lentinula raphanica]|nr:hypothetical protein EV360DRAFT_66339 [Lentinula raphanica]